MSSGFVSGGTADAPIERSDEWLAAQTELEANRARKAAAAQQPSGRSLFETLEANKAAKQDAFEEANRLKNQFRALDDDEVEFLDSVLESTRREEERVRRETAEGLEVFRRQQDEADRKARGGEGGEEPVVVEEEWVSGGRKRKRMKEKEGLKGVKVRRSSSGIAGDTTSSEGKKEEKANSKSVPLEELAEPKAKPAMAAPTPKPAPAAPKASTGLGLVDYGSDDDD